MRLKISLRMTEVVVEVEEEVEVDHKPLALATIKVEGDHLPEAMMAYLWDLFLKQMQPNTIMVTRIYVVVEVIVVEEEIEVAEENEVEVNRELNKEGVEAEATKSISRKESKSTKRTKMKLKNFWTTNKETSNTFYSTKTSLLNKHKLGKRQTTSLQENLIKI